MEFTSINFLLFSLFGLLIYYMLPVRWRLGWLAGLSLAFIASWGIWLLVFYLILTALNYWLGLKIEEKPGLSTVGIVLNLLAIILLKYHVFILQWVNGSQAELPSIFFVGISFYGVQVISYFADIKNKRTAVVRNMIHFYLYMLYFPKFLAGPIERKHDFITQIEKPTTVNEAHFAQGFTLIMVGLVRKLVIANTLSRGLLEFDLVLEYAENNTWFFLLGYGIYLYNDFAGYTNIARGLSFFFGIQLKPNFARPYFAKNLTEFWNRWHISLSHWLRDYIFFPTMRSLLKKNRNRLAPINIILPPMITMLVSALWHGLSWHMLVWGGIHGASQIIERYIDIKIVPKRKIWLQKFLRPLLTLIFVFFAWLPFRLSLPSAFAFVQSLNTWQSPIWGVLGLTLLSFAIDIAQERDDDEFVFLHYSRTVRITLLAFSYLAIFLSTRYTGAPFIYAGF